jgi:hypothetical protein
MRIVILGLCALIAALTVQNIYLQENLQEAFRGEQFYSKMIQRYSTDLYEARINETQE